MANEHLNQLFAAIINDFTVPYLATEELTPCPHCGSIECDGYWSPQLGGCPKHPDNSYNDDATFAAVDKWNAEFEKGWNDRKIEIEEEL